jgi:UDP-N-acetylglucosamine 2-epimerase
MNNNSKSIILFDSVSDYDDLDEIASKNKSKIISFNYDTHKILKDKKIHHEISDNYLSKKDLRTIQKTAYSISEWFNADVISKYIYYNGVNLGSLIQDELINILVNYIKKVFELFKISKEFTNSTFISSHTCCKIMKNFSKKINEFKNSSTENLQPFPLDSIKIKMKIGTKNHSMEFGISKNLFKKLKSVSEKSSKFLLSKNNSIGETSKNILIVEFNPIQYQSFFEQMPDSKLNFLIYNRRRPAFWNFQSYNLIKRSGCLAETENSLLDAKLKKIILNGKRQIEIKISDLFSKESFFKSFFSLEEISFWPTFKEFFQEYFRKRALEFIQEVELTKKLMEKYDFSSILILSEAGLHERIALQLAYQKQIPVCLVQHGINYNTKESYDMNVAKGALPIKSDYYLCWGRISGEYSKKMAIKSEKVHPIGSAVFDGVTFDEQKCSKKDHVLLATGSPTKEHASDLTVEIIEKNMDAVKKICQVVTKYNKKLIIKTHPSPDEFDPSFIAKQVNPEIKVIKEGRISPLIQSCDLLIINDLTSPILDAYILKKPVISLRVTDNGWGIPTAFKNNSCIVTDLEKFDDDLKNVLNNESVRNQLITDGEKSSKEYLAYQNNGSNKLITFLEELVN